MNHPRATLPIARPRRASLRVFARLTLAALAWVACGKNGSSVVSTTSSELRPATPPASPSETARAALPEAQSNTIPPGRWRLVPFAQLLGVGLPLSHLLIRHAGAASTQVSLNLLEWRTPHPEVSRSRAEALRLAEELASRAARDPGRFAEIARQFSEDPISASSGGRLGVIAATHLSPWPQVLDAIAATAPGRITPVVETPSGFHVFLREAVPEERIASGEHIVIGHEDAPIIGDVARREATLRTRSEALELARAVYEQARTNPHFAELVDRYSDHADAARAGDFGSWSSREPGAMSREVAVLHELEVGEVAPPIETVIGFQIIRRVPHRDREDYGASVLEVGFEPSLPSSEPGSKVWALYRAHEWLEQVKRLPDRFSALQREHCCIDLSRVAPGRQMPAVEMALAGLEPGQIAPEPIEAPGRYWLVKRVPLSALPPPPRVTGELPSPATVDMDYLASNFKARFWARELDEVEKKASLSTPNAASVLAELHAPWAQLAPDTVDTRRQLLHEMDSQLLVRLGGHDFEQYRAVRTEHLERVLLNRQR
jgi:hypothetical protein